MPMYEYECTSCKKVHEIIQKFSDPAVENCPDCQAPVKKLMSMNSFSLKGAGWYTTDYKRSSSSSKSSDAPACAAAGTCGSAGSCDSAN